MTGVLVARVRALGARRAAASASAAVTAAGRTP